MKLSDVKGENQAEILGKAIPLLEKLSKNKEINQLFSIDVSTPESKEKAEEQIIKNIKAHLPEIINKAGKTLVEYAALIGGKEKSEVSAGEIFITIVDMINDPAFLNFFALYRPQTAKKS